MITCNIIQMNDLKNELNYQKLFFEAFYDIFQSQSKYEFSNKAKEWCKILFSTTSTKFLFVENDSIIEYISKTE